MEFITLLDKSYNELVSLNLCLSCSCGKDSTALAILCKHYKIPLKFIVRYINNSDFKCFDSVWNGIKNLYKDTDTQFVELYGSDLFDSIVSKKHYYNLNNDRYYGYVPCGVFSRWGTEEKQEILNEFSVFNKCTNIIGIASGENRAIYKNNSYFLIELGITEKQALNICIENGFQWYELTDFGFYINIYDYIDRDEN